MSAFWGLIALMMLGCLAFIMLPLSRPRAQVNASESQVSLAIHRERLRELEAYHAQGMTSAEALRQARDDIARQILQDAAPCEDAPVPAADRGALLAAALAIPAVAVLLYFWLGDVGVLNEVTLARQAPPMAYRNATVADASAQLRVQVALSPALRHALPAQAMVFVFARPIEGPRMPLAMVRRPARELPFEVALGDGQAMSAEHRLSQHPRVMVGARISASGNAMPQTGDLEGLSAPLEWARAGMMRVEIDHVVH